MYGLVIAGCILPAYIVLIIATYLLEKYVHNQEYPTLGWRKIDRKHAIVYSLLWPIFITPILIAFFLMENKESKKPASW